MKRIGFLGPKGTFSHEAVKKYTVGKEGFVECDFNTIQDMILSVHNSKLSEAIVPIENSLEGGSAISNTLDMLAFDTDLKIKAELILKVEQNLLAPEGVELSDIECIISHPQALGQCRKFIDQNYPQALLKPVLSTAKAAMDVVSSGGKCAAIGPLSLAEEYGLKVLKSGIQDNLINETRFVVISHDDSDRTGCDKTSIVFSTENEPGSLYGILDIFNLWDINLTRIESRPAKIQLGRYIFFVDLEGHREDDDLKDALTMVKRKASFYKFLGSYPAAVSREMSL